MESFLLQNLLLHCIHVKDNYSVLASFVFLWVSMCVINSRIISFSYSITFAMIRCRKIIFHSYIFEQLLTTISMNSVLNYILQKYLNSIHICICGTIFYLDILSIGHFTMLYFLCLRIL